MSDLNAKWRELVKAGKAEWRPGMSGQLPDNRFIRVANDLAPYWGGAGVRLGDTVPEDTLPEWDDPATLGCLLAMVRAAWGDDDIYFGSSLSFKRKRWSWVKGGGEHIGQGDTEAEALLAALEAAP
mgnify:CR=1 FL=1